MKQYLVTASQMKRYDSNTIVKYQVPSLILMERAALVTIEEIQRVRENKPCRVLVAAGCGNNGGDGLAVGRLLMLQGYEVTCVLLGSEERCTKETARQIAILRQYGAEIFSTIQDGEYDIVIDAVFGIGLSRPVEGVCLHAIEWMNRASAYVCSVDIPSGIRADTGEVLGCAVSADMTVAYGFYKVGHMLYPGAGYTGRLVCRQMGIDARSFLGVEPYWYTHIGAGSVGLPARRLDGNKGTFGKVLVVAGNSRIAGAAMLSAKSTFRVGAGMVKVVTAIENRDILQQYVPEAMILTYREDESYGNGSSGKDSSQDMFMQELKKAEEWADVILIGPGLGMDSFSHELLGFSILESNLPLVIDADGLNLLAQDKMLQEALSDRARQERAVILTPHVGEFARLYGCTIGEVKGHLTDYPRKLSDRLHCILVCKDARTIVVWPGGEQGYINTTGNSGMATAGSGDVLAGMVAGFLAQKLPGVAAAVAGVYFHGAAGDLAAEQGAAASVLATDIIDRIGDAMAVGACN